MGFPRTAFPRAAGLFPGPQHSRPPLGALASAPGAGKEDVGVPGTRDPKLGRKGDGWEGRARGHDRPLQAPVHLSLLVRDCPLPYPLPVHWSQAPQEHPHLEGPSAQAGGALTQTLP